MKTENVPNWAFYKLTNSSKMFNHKSPEVGRLPTKLTPLLQNSVSTQKPKMSKADVSKSEEVFDHLSLKAETAETKQVREEIGKLSTEIVQCDQLCYRFF